MTPALLVLAALQGPAPDVTASVDRVRVRVGEELVLRVEVHSRAPGPVTFLLPSLDGFALVGSREASDVSISGPGGPRRTTVRELRLRAEWPGHRALSRIRVAQGSHLVEVVPITVEVDSALAGTAATLGARARDLLERASVPDSADRVALSLVVPGDTVSPGEQMDLLAVAWFPRDMRLRLRQRPAVALRTPDGVWAYPQAVPGDVALSRQVDGRWMDLFVAHQVVFPLQAGTIHVPSAVVEFALPVTYSFFSREDRYALQSDPAVIAVRPLPTAGRPTGDVGVVGRDLRVDLSVSTRETRVGEPMEVSATLDGVGNVALWPEPAVRWPPGFRAYAAQTVVTLEPLGGRTAGTKTFTYLVVPDSAGTFVLPQVAYPYYDTGARAYRVTRSAARAVAVAPGTEPRAARALPPLVARGRPSWPDRVAARLGLWGWVAVAVAPPLLVLAARRRRRRLVEHAVPRGDPLAALEREFQAALAAHVPDPDRRAGGGLAQALRAAGVEGPVAEHVARLRDRLRAARFGPRAASDLAELAAEVRRVLRFLDGGPRRRRRLHAGLVALVAVLATRPVAAQAPSAEALYEAGALRAAADSFAARADGEPSVAAHWYNLGANLYRAGADGKAIAAWTRAARLAPRLGLARRARELLPPPDGASDPLLAVGLATPGEWALAAGACWLLLWLAVLARRNRAVVAALALLTAGAALPGWLEWSRRARPVAVVLQADTPVRGAPYGTARAHATLQAGAAVLLGRPYGGWVEVRRHDGIHGWVLAAEVSRL